MRNRIVLFSKQDCAPCTQVKAWLVSNSIRVLHIDPHDQPELARMLNVRSVPTTVVVQMDDDENRSVPLFRVVGFKPEELETLKQYQHE